MARDHVEYLIAQELIRTPLMNNGLSTGIRVAELSKDYETGAVSYYASIGPQWIRRETGYYDCDLEILLVEGDLEIGNTNLSEGDYTFFPAGCLQGPTFTNNGCKLFMLFEGKPLFVHANSSRDDAREELKIDKIEVKSMPWEPPPSHEGRPASEAPPGLGIKYLRVNPDTKGYTLLTKQPEGWFDPKLEKHSIWEELILLDGDYLMGKMGKVTAGTYIFRDGSIAHGPQVSKHGCVWFARGPSAIDFDYQEEELANKLVEKYLSSEQIFTGKHETGPWGNWM